MPILNYRAPNVHPIHGIGGLPSEILADIGLLIQVILHVPSPIAEQLKKEGKPVPVPIVGTGRIDTAAQICGIAEESARELNLPIVDRGQVSSATDSQAEGNLYPIELELPDLGMTIDIPYAFVFPRSGSEPIAIIGLDVLKNLVLLYNGPAGSFTLAC